MGCCYDREEAKNLDSGLDRRPRKQFRKKEKNDESLEEADIEGNNNFEPFSTINGNSDAVSHRRQEAFDRGDPVL